MPRFEQSLLNESCLIFWFFFVFCFFKVVDLVVVDIEGTVVPLSFVKEELFGWLRGALEEWVARNKAHAAVAEASRAWQVSVLHVAEEAVKRMGWDSKEAALKQLQGAALEERWPQLSTPLYEDVAAALRRWRARGTAAAVYSSGAAAAQRRLFERCPQPDMLGALHSFHDPASAGPKTLSSSYAAIRAAAFPRVAHPLFLTDSPLEAVAALEAGWRVALVDRPGNNPLPSPPPAPVISSFDALFSRYRFLPTPL